MTQSIRKDELMKKIGGFLLIVLIMSSIFFVKYPKEAGNTLEDKTDTVQGKAIDLNTIRRSNKDYYPLSEAQLQKYLDEGSISPLTVQNIGKYTVVLYKTKSLIKTLRLTSNQDGNIIYAGGGGYGDNSKITPVSVGFESGESEIGYIGFSTVIINDFDLLKNAYMVKCYYENNITTTTLVDNHNAFIDPFPQEKVELINVIVSDKDSKVLFDKNEWLKKM